MDFTLKKYKSLIEAFKDKKYNFLSFKEYMLNSSIINDSDLIVILRHDVDDKPLNSLKIAELENFLGISGTYYFRIVPCSWDEKIIKKIDSMNHEIGYHYETMDSNSGKLDLAWKEFQNNLNKLRRIVNVKTICMHGSPKSKFDNKDIWKKYDYRKLDLIGEPYLDLDFNKILYLTDTGRRWDGFNVSIRDKVEEQKIWINKGFIFHSTNDIINRLLYSDFPNHVMINIHPQRWNVKFSPWFKELIIQNLKNQIKQIIIKINK